MTLKRHFLLTALLLAGLVLGAVLPLPAQTWRSLGPEGGNAVGLVRDPHNSRLIYAVLSPGGVYKSADGGVSWTFAGQGIPTDITLGGLAVDPADSSVLYLASGHLFKSTDGGGHWAPLSWQPNGSLHQIAVSPHNPSVLIALTESHAYRSLDGGANWSIVYSIGWSSSIKIADVVFDPVNAGTAYIGVKNGGIVKSTDNGATWPQISYDIKPVDLVFDPGAPSVLYAVVPSSGVYKSSNGGTSWTLWNSGMSMLGDSFGSNFLTCFAPGPVGSGYYYAGSERGVFRSTDNGESWGAQAITWNWPTTRALLVDPSNKEIVLAATSPLGIYRTTSAGADWAPSRDGLDAVYIDARALAVSPADPSRIVLGTSFGILWSSNRGASWTFASVISPSRNPSTRTAAAHPTNALVFLAGTNQGIYKTTNGGDFWPRVYAELPTDLGTRSIVFDPVQSDTIYAGGTSWPPLYKSVDGGANWAFELSTPSSLSINTLAVDPSQSGVIYAGLNGGWPDPDGPPGYYLAKSVNGGTTWTGLAGNIIYDRVNAVVVDPANSSSLFVAGRLGFFKSDDGGATWRRIQGNLGSGEVYSLAIDPRSPHHLYAAAAKKVLRSTDAGETWTVFGTGLPLDDYITLAVDPSDSAIVYAGSGGKGGLFRTAAEGFPVLRVDTDTLNFGAQGGIGPSSGQNVRIFNGGSGVLHWTAEIVGNWNDFAQVTPASGTGNGTVRVTVDSSRVPPCIVGADVKIHDPNAADSPRYVRIWLKKYSGGPLGPPQPPFGSFDTPLDGATIRSSIAVTGWALDDIEVMGVKIYRDPANGEPGGRKYIGNATFVEGSRPDIETIYHDYPFQRRAGWGYMLLTNFLPNNGNGTFTLRAVATDKEGNEVELGSRMITCDNAHAVLPFGAIDTPEQGGQISGSGYFNFGWALTPMPNSIPTDGSTIGVWIDGVLIGHPSYNNYRDDIATLFPGYANSLGAVGLYTFDTTGCSNGVHTIAWSVRDNAGNEDGVGSRYFSILNEGVRSQHKTLGITPGASVDFVTQGLGSAGEYSRLDDLRSLRDISKLPVYVRKGFNRSLPPDRFLAAPVIPRTSVIPRTYVIPSASEGSLLQIRELERLELLLSDEAFSADAARRTAERAGFTEASSRIEGSARIGGSSRIEVSSRASARDLSSPGAFSSRWQGYLIVGDELRPLPIGSTLDAAAGVFSWLPGPGFLGDYRLAFIDRESRSKTFLTIRIEPRGGVRS